MQLKINSNIPNTMSHKGLEYLARIASTAESGSTILEAGSLFGCTGWVLSKNAPSTCKVFAIDPWVHEGFLHKFKKNNLRVPDLSIHAFRAYTQDCSNLVPVQGFSPHAADDLPLENLDIVFEDAVHSYELLKANIEYFYPKIKPGGIFCGDDYQSSFPGVIKAVDELADSLNVKPEVCGQVWAIRKPSGEAGGNVYHRIGDYYDREILVSTIDEDDRELVASPHCFVGNLFSPKKLKQLSLSWSSTDSNFKGSFSWQVKFRGGRKSEKYGPGETVSLEGRELAGVKVELDSVLSKEYSVGYQIAEFKNADDHLKSLGTSREVFNGSWLEVRERQKEIYSLSVSLADRELRSMRTNHWKLVDAGKQTAKLIYPELS